MCKVCEEISGQAFDLSIETTLISFPEMSRESTLFSVINIALSVKTF